MTLDRRTLLRGAAATGATLVTAGVASAGDGTAEYVVTGNGPAARDRVVDAGYEVTRTVADAQVLGVRGPADAEDDLGRIAGVRAVSRDVAVDIEYPLEIRETDGAATADVDPFFAENQWDNDLLDLAAAREIATGEGTRVAVVDTGIQFDHPDLGNVEPDLGATFVPDGAPARPDGEDSPERGHGTNVAGIVGATGAVGAVGVAPDTELVPVRVFPDDGPARFIDVFAGIDYASAIGADVANFSLGTITLPPQANRGGIRAAVQTVFEAAVREGTVVTASAGNGSANLQQGGQFTLPTSVAGAFSVSATAPNDERTFYSNFGTNEIDVGAPGGGYESLLKTLYGIREWVLAGQPVLRSDHPLDEGDPGKLLFDAEGNIVFSEEAAATVIEFTSPAWPYPFNLAFTTFFGGGYGWTAGTSFSAPQAAGLAALVRDAAPGLNPKQVERAIEDGAELAPGDSDPELGAGRVNALNTLELVAGRGADAGR